MFKFSKRVRNRYFINILFFTFLVLLASGFMPHVNAEELENNVTDDIDLSVKDNEVNSLMNSIVPNGNSFKDIQDAINRANEGDTVILNQKEYFGSGEQIYLNKQVNIHGDYNGQMPVLNALNLNRVLLIEEGVSNLKIDNCKFVNGNITLGGGAILIRGVNVTIDNCYFEANEARGGGAIYTEYPGEVYTGMGDYLKIYNSYFYKNNAHIAAGALGIYGNNSEIRNCTFEENFVDNKYKEQSNVYGGAIQIGMDNYYLVSSCVNCTFINNKATSPFKEYSSHGGACCVRDGITFDGCYFIGNIADQGGALTYHSAGYVLDCYFENNTALSLYGGALSTGFNVTDMILAIEDCEFRGNDAPIGGAVHLIGEEVTLDNCKFYENIATLNGGAIYIDARSTFIKNSLIGNNTAKVNGGGVYINSDSTSIENNQFIGNKAIPSTSKLNDGLGGAIFINGTNADIKNNILNYNMARNGSAIYIGKLANKIQITGNYMSNNQAWVYLLPVILSKDVIFTGESIGISSVIYGGNNIGEAFNDEVSNAIYSNADPSTVFINGVNPVNGANMDFLYQDSREHLIEIGIKVIYEDGTVITDFVDYSNINGEISVELSNLKAGQYTVYTVHNEDNFYKGIVNSTTFTVLPQNDLKVSKNSNLPQYEYKDVIKWTLTVSNSGPDVATNVKVTDVLPEALIWIGDDSGGAYNPETGIWTIGELAVGESITLTIISVANKTGNITNIANVSGDEYDFNESNNEDNESVSVNPAVDLEIIKEVSNTNPNFREEIVWTLTVINKGPDVANDVKVRDVLPDGLIFLSANGFGDYDPLTGMWDIGKLNVGQIATLKILVLVNKTGSIVNVVVVSGNESDFNESNNEDNETIYVNNSADLEVIKTVNNTNPKYNEEILWNLTVVNNGPDSASNVRVIDVLPEELLWISDNGEGSYKDNTWTIGKLGVDESVSLLIRTLVNGTGYITNIAEVSGNEHDCNLTNNKNNESINVSNAVDLQIDKKVDYKNPIFGDIVKWEITAFNKGPDIATGVVVYDRLPDSLIFISASSDDYNPSTGCWNIGILNSNESRSIEIVCKVNGLGELLNKVQITGNEYDYDLSNNNDSESVISDKIVDLVVNKEVNNTNPNYHEYIKWTITISNKGPNDATGVTVKDILPEGLIYVSSSGGGRFNGNIWNIGNLISGEVKSLDIICYVNKTGHFVNVAIASGNEDDSNETNNQDSQEINVKPAADLSITKESSKINYDVGDMVDFVVTIKNNGPDAANIIVVEDIADSLLDIVSYSSDKGSFSDDGKTWFVNFLDNGEVATLMYKAIGKSVGSAGNKVNVISDVFDPNMDNNNDCIIVNLIENILNPTNFINYNSVDSNIVKTALAAQSNSNGNVLMKVTGSPAGILSILTLVFLSFLGMSNLKRK